ncbi:N-acetyltransferase [Leuconostoc litchii]|uniref:N-acetyltransferase n=1 Tax=Leuconostoc litchii TaxID=1981069 RepID=A0A6P2CLW4_9LACO|nr:GNAT family protein [Leuconostoc litchii]TYC46574.1 N-acetyltransferase [Leuconostoc litchii]GMA70426.1 N-acetyltransferase [Leuconostoc litchii]
MITLRKFKTDDLALFWDIAYSDPNAEWTKWNGPYFKDILPTREEFINKIGPENYVNNSNRRLVIMNDQIIGAVSAYFEDGQLQSWLEAGIVIYRQNIWQQGVGSTAFKMWLAALFQQYPNLPHIGLTTWSGNKAMMRVSDKIGLKLEGQIRQVRWWQGKYWDSMKYGILREEMTALSSFGKM